ncbi:type IV secretion system DNA-binding domain-containing protein [Nitrosomonas sp.]|uniref:type IV secretory system conjugative DNA transfer family protein n=1 Tax=Nitrosomonas sp. TaxID=42353 RepID=UPI0032EB3A92
MAHFYVIGGSGVGKSSLIKHKILEDINDGFGVCFIDPHGHDIDELIGHIPKDRIKDTILFDPTDPTHCISWNPLQESNNQPLTATVIADTIKDAWGYHGMTTPVMDMFLYFTVFTLLENNLSFYQSLSLLTDKDYRSKLSFNNLTVKQFWDMFNAMTDKEQREATASTLNKLFILFGDDRLRRIFDTTKGRFSVSEIVKDKIILVRLPQGQLGMSKVSLIGSLLLSQIHLACLKRDPSIPYCIYIDEVHSFTASTISEMLSGLRKFNVHITVAHQYVKQLDRELFDSLMSNCNYKQVFRVSPEDALRFQERMGRNGDINLDELGNFIYRTFPWHNIDLDKDTEPLGDIPRPSNLRRIKNNTHTLYCERIKIES